MSVKSQCFRCEVKKGTKWSAAKKAEEGRRKLVSFSPPTPLPHYWDCGRSCRHLTNLKDLPPNLNSVSMTSLSVAVILCPSERQSSVICFWFILPLPDLSYTENASLNSDKKNCISLSNTSDSWRNYFLRELLVRVGVSLLKFFGTFRPRFLTVLCHIKIGETHFRSNLPWTNR